MSLPQSASEDAGPIGQPIGSASHQSCDEMLVTSAYKPTWRIVCSMSDVAPQKM